MRSDLNILFYLKKPKNYQYGPLPIYLRMTVGQKRCELALKREIEPDDWDKAKKRAKGTREEARVFNHYIDAISFKIQRIHSQMIANGDEITAEEIKETFLGKNLKSRLLIEVYQAHNDEMESMIGNGFSENTFRTFKSSLKHIKEFISSKYQVDDIAVKKVDQSFIKSYENHLKTKKNKCTPISADKYIKHLKKIMLRCF